MSAFDSTTKVRRIVSDPLTDCELPESQDLSLARIASDNALAGTQGAHCELIHGDMRQQTSAVRKVHMTGCQESVVGGDQTIKIDGKHKETIVGSCSQNIVGPHLLVNHTVRNETRLGKCTTTYGVNVREDDHNGAMYYADGLYELALVWNVEAAATKLSIQPLHVEIKAIHAYASLVQPFAPILDVAEKLMKAKEAVSLAKLSLVRTEIHNLKDDLNLLNSQLNSGVLIPVDPNGTPLF